MRLPLVGGAYSARSNIASCTRAVNLFPEINPRDFAVVPMTHYQRPGMQFVTNDIGNLSQVRGIWSRSDNNGGYVVIGSTVYYLDNTLTLTSIGTIGTSTGTVYFTDNGVTCMLVDGSANGYFIQFVGNVFSTIVDPTGIFTGATSVDTLDTFILWGFLNSNFFGSTLAGSTSFDGLYFAAKAAFPDYLARLIVNKREILLLGTKRSEIWYNTGGAQFPFALLPGIYIQQGTVAPASAAFQNIEVYWLSSNEQGQGIVIMQRGYETRRISNHALEYQIRQMSQTGTIQDAVGFTLQFDGHVFYVLTFPTGDQTWVYDASVSEPNDAWHQWAWTDSSGGLHKCRANCGAYFPNAVFGTINGVYVMGDWQNGSLYALNPNYYFDDAMEDPGNVGGLPSTSPSPISWIRTFHHIGKGRAQGTLQLGETDGRRVKYNYFYADIDSGQIPLGVDANPLITLRWSDDRGNTWLNGILQPSGPQGHFTTWPTWRTLGYARDRIFELSFSAAGQTALNGAWVDAEILDS
jgi:hypothetical protein